MAYKTSAVLAVAAATVLMATGCALAGERGSASDWKPPQVVGQPGYKEEPAKPREAAAPRPVTQDPHGARNPNAPRGR